MARNGRIGYVAPMIDALEHRRGEIAEVCRRHGVRWLDVFGSAARGTDFGPESDIDLLVDYEPAASMALRNFFALREALAEVVGRRVDLIMSAALKNPYLRASVDRSRRRLYGA